MSSTKKPAPYYVDALREEILATWGGHPRYSVEGGPADHVEEMCFQRMLTSFYDDDRHALDNRKELLYHRLSALYDTTSIDKILPKTRGILPVDSILPKVVDTLASAYSVPPTRTWVTPDGVEDVVSTTALRDMYRRDGLDGRLLAALRRAKLCSGCLVGAYVGRRGRMQLQILPPDLFRAETDPLFPDHLLELTLPMLRYTDEGGLPLEEPKRVYQVWTDTLVRYVSFDESGEVADFMWEPNLDEKGDQVVGEDGVPELVMVEQRENRYGRIPFVIMRLVEPDSNATFGGGLAWVVDGNLALNGVALNAELSTHYESHGHWLAINVFKSTDVLPPSMGFGGITSIDNVNPEEKVPPSLTPVSQNGQYTNLLEYKKSGFKELQVMAGVPRSEADEQSQPLSGISRFIERKPLLEARKNDIRNLAFVEQEISDIVVRVHNVDRAEKLGHPPIPDGLLCETTFADEDLLMEPEAALKVAESQFLAGTISPSRYIRDTTGNDLGDDEEAVEFIIKNREYRARILAGVVEGEGGAPQQQQSPPQQAAPPPPPTSSEPP